MPELPEVEITARRLNSALAGARVGSALAPGINVMKSFQPSLDQLIDRKLSRVRRLGKMVVVEFGDLSLLIHLMSAGRLGLFERPASAKDRASRLLIGVGGGRELRLREFGTKQRAWARLVASATLEDQEMVASLGPEAWPAPGIGQFAALISQPHQLHPLLREQRTIAGIGRCWADEILWRARLSPFKRGTELSEEEVGRLHDSLGVLGEAIEHYEEVLGERLPDKLPMPLEVHRREGQPCPRCANKIEAVFFAEHQINYCPTEQTGGRVLKDRRLSRLLK